MVTTCGCPSSQAPGPLGFLTCQRNIKFIYQSFKYIFPVATAMVVGVYTDFYSFFVTNESNEISYKPFIVSTSGLSKIVLSTTTSGLGKAINVIEATSKTKGSSEGDLIFAHPDGSKIFAGADLNYIVAGPGPDIFHFSLCNDEMSVIQEFDPRQDKISYACTKTTIYPENITILHETIEEQEVTYVHVAGNEKISAIALLGNIPLTVDGVLLNQLWDEI
jgi:hypothetical protein